MGTVYDEGKKAAAKAEFFTVPPESTFLGGATYRDKFVDALDYIGMDKRGKNFLVGDPHADGIIDSIGLADFFPPTGLPMAVQEGSRSLDQGRYVEGALDLGLSALELLPGMVILSKPVKKFFSSLASKSSENLGALPPPTQPSRSSKVDAILNAEADQQEIDELLTGEVPVNQFEDDLPVDVLDSPMTSTDWPS